MRCIKCHSTVRCVRGITKDTQICRNCRGTFTGRPRSRLTCQPIYSHISHYLEASMMCKIKCVLVDSYYTERLVNIQTYINI